MSQTLIRMAAESILRESEQRRRAEKAERDALRMATRIHAFKVALEQVDRIARLGVAFAPPEVEAALRVELERYAEEVRS